MEGIQYHKGKGNKDILSGVAQKLEIYVVVIFTSWSDID
jgi:hypothetical protein